ncbi:hypothetical protein SAMN05444678_11443 [Sphingomonas sp. YR710]|uniref:hypothetical protein n=1 Tax=Sphingomonas sp. YR710 TaxID=1882773 RepID=UPI00088B050A|nr:hypothetical protein [Sphingomonas sp. YR710]SDD49219.1 hypothetical protein SAMN05444678_11443 [Sphingomonas sp. YR710]
MCDHIISSDEPFEPGVYQGLHEVVEHVNLLGGVEREHIVATIDDHVRAVEHIMRALIGPDARLSCDLRASGAEVRLPSAAIEAAMLQLVNHARACSGVIRSVAIRTRRSCGRICVIFVYRSAMGKALSYSAIRDELALLTARRLVQSADGQFRIRFSKAVGNVILLTFPAVPGAMHL